MTQEVTGVLSHQRKDKLETRDERGSPATATAMSTLLNSAQL